MSTATVDHSATGNTTNKTLDFGKPEYTTINKDVAFGYEIDDKGKKVAVVLDVDEATKLEQAGKFEGSVVSTITTLPANWAAVRELENKIYLDAENKPRDVVEVLNELVTLFRPGMGVKATNRRNQRLLDQDKDGNFTFNDSGLKGGVLDLTDEITSPSKRVFRTEEQKTWDNLSNLAPTVRESVWRAYLTATGKEYYIPATT